jgi:accessory gene regulator protein AgrB
MRKANLEGRAAREAKTPQVTEHHKKQQGGFIVILLLLTILLFIMTPVGCATLLAVLTPTAAAAP